MVLIQSASHSCGLAHGQAALYYGGKMFSRFKKDKSIPQGQPNMRDILFGDESFEKVATHAKGSSDALPWSHFATAEQILRQGDKSRAADELRKVLEMKGLESRVYLQAWHCLRTLSVFPPAEIATQIQGIVVEMALEKSLDLVAAYADHSARYFNFSGAGIVWDATHDPEIIQITDRLLAVGQEIIRHIGLWDKPRPPAPPKGSIRINLLTYGGLYFGEGDLEVMAKDSLGGPAVSSAFTLMKALIARTDAA
ncbi:MAG: hypothetical protein WA821_11085 [Anaerolineales bacterium]